MEKHEYKNMFYVEEDSWWYVGLRKLVFSYINKFSNEKVIPRILDAGCGTGRIVEECKVYNAYGMDISQEAIKFCTLRNLNKLLRGSISKIPFKNNTFDIVISLDVLYHMRVKDDSETLKELYRVINNNGILLLNLPAFNFLKSGHDKAMHTKRRYTIRDLKEKVEKAGFIVDRITYRNTILFPIALIMRIMTRLFLKDTVNTRSDNKQLPGLLNTFLKNLMLLENRVIISGLNLPFGLSLYCVARKKI
jgi:SAM-dependent methyltransferase